MTEQDTDEDEPQFLVEDGKLVENPDREADFEELTFDD